MFDKVSRCYFGSDIDFIQEKSLYLAAYPQPCSPASDLGGESHYMIIIFSNAGSLESINLSIGCQNSDGENIDRQECYKMKFDCR